MPKSKAWVVKVGGSLAGHAALPAWLAACARIPAGSVIVPGGGAFRAAVQTSQATWQYPDDVAHRMAILAMAQFGLMLNAISPVPVAQAIGLNALRSGVGACDSPLLWVPTLSDIEKMRALPADWTVSADSIALWLAGLLAIPRLALIKTALPVEISERPGDAARGVVDAHFPRLLARQPCAVHYFDAGALERFKVLAAQQ